MSGENLQSGLGRRLAWGMGVSVLFNLGIWGFAARTVQHDRAHPPEVVEITRLILPATPPTVLKPRPNAVAPPKPPPTVSVRPRPLPKPIVQFRAMRSPPPEAVPRIPSVSHTHNRVLISHGSAPALNTALRGGGATPGVPASTQDTGNETQDALSAPSPPMPPAAEPAPPHHDAPAPVPTPPVPVTMPQPNAPSPSGPTIEAQVERLVLPEIPDDLQQEDYKSSVHVTVDIDAQGGATHVTLNSSSGNAEVDRRVIDALKRSRYQPALQNGRPIASAKRFRFDFEVR